MKRFYVTYYYQATGMEGHADRQALGYVDARDEKEACEIMAMREHPTDERTRSFFLRCLTAKEQPMSTITYQASSLEDIAQAFDKRAKQCDKQAAGAERMKHREYYKAQSGVWSTAAAILRSTTLQAIPHGAGAGSYKEID